MAFDTSMPLPINSSRLLAPATRVHACEREEVHHAEVFRSAGACRHDGLEVRLGVQEGLGVGLEKADENLSYDAPADRAKVETVLDDLGLLQDVVPERRRGLETEAISSKLFKVSRRQWCYPHRAGDCLPGGQLPGEVPQEVALRQSQ